VLVVERGTAPFWLKEAEIRHSLTVVSLVRSLL
jgi:hypothetical protein